MRFVSIMFLVTSALSFASPEFAETEEWDNLEDADVVEFHITKGTGKNPWNSQESLATVKVGQTLRIFNDDTIDHYLHTTGSRPCPHGSGKFAPGTFYDCVVTKTADPDKDLCYDHQFGESSRFYIKATN